MKSTSKIFLYTGFALAAVIIFLYLLFPSELFRDVLEERVAQINPDLMVVAETIRPTIPPGLKLQSVVISHTDFPVMRSDYLKVTPNLFSLLSDPKVFNFKGPLGSGDFRGRGEINRKTKRPQDKVTLNLNNIPVEVFEILERWPQYKPSGELSGRVNYDSLKGAGGTVEADVRITPLQIKLDPPLMGIETLDFSELKAQMTMTPRMLQIRRCEANGNQLEGKLTGSIVFSKPFGNSRVTMSLTVKPRPEFIAQHKNDIIGGFLASDKAQKRGILFRFSGTLDNPSYR
ncbi:MAG: type II secretion system protein GspN, partial [Desulfobacteraceae bacterium]